MPSIASLPHFGIPLNGAGKTTIDMQLGLLPPDSGTVSLFGRPPADAIARGGVGAMLQTGSLLPQLMVAELLEMMAAVYPEPMPVGDVLEAVGITDIAGRMTHRLSGRRSASGSRSRSSPTLLCSCSTSRPSRWTWRADTTYLRYEILRIVRARRFVVFSIAFPLILYYLIAAPNRSEHDFGGSGISAPLYLMAGLAAFGTMNTVLATGSRIAAERPSAGTGSCG